MPFAGQGLGFGSGAVDILVDSFGSRSNVGQRKSAVGAVGDPAGLHYKRDIVVELPL